MIGCAARDFRPPLKSAQEGAILPLTTEFAAFAPPALSGIHHRILPAAIVTIIFAAVAYRMRAVDLGGAAAGAAASFLLYVSAGPAAFVTLAAVFALAAGSTRLGYGRKQRLGLAERKHGRTASQVLANLVAAAALSAASLYGHREVWLLASVAALAEAAADTAASECGQALSTRVYLVTTFERVPVGTDGGISTLGTLCGVVAALLVALVAAWGQLLPTHWIAAASGAAVLGTFVDSVLGATLQQRGWLNNNGVNFASTVAATGFALLFLL